MKKRFVLLTFLLIGVLALSACSGGGSSNNGTPAGGTEGVPDTGGFATDTFPTQMTGTELPGSGISTLEPTTSFGGGLSTSESTFSTPTSQVGVVTTAQATSVVQSTSQSNIPTTGSDLVELSAMMNFTVQDNNGNEIGRVVDYVVNVCEAHIAYIAVDASSAAVSGTNSGSNTTSSSNGAVSGTSVSGNSVPSTGSGNVILIPYQAATSLNGVLCAGVFNNNGASNSNAGNSGSVSGTPVSGTSVPSTGSQSGSTGGFNQSGDVIVVNLGGADLSTFPAVSMSALQSSDVTWEANVINYWGPYMKLGLTTACSVPANGGTTNPTGAAPDVAGTPVVSNGAALSGTAVTAGSPTRTSDRVTVNKVALASEVLNADLTEGNGGMFGKIRDAVIIRNTGGIMYYVVQAVAGNQQGIGNNAGGNNTVGTVVPSGTQSSPSTQNNSGTGTGVSNSNAAGLIALPPGAVMVRHDGNQVTFYLLVPAGVATSGPAYTGSFNGFDTSTSSNWFTYWQQYLPMTQSQLP